MMCEWFSLHNGLGNMANKKCSLHPIILLSLVCLTATASPVVIQPGKPGMPSKLLPSSELLGSPVEPLEADVHFMQGMIHHHAQAIEMVNFLRTKAQRQALKDLGERISISQADEIEYMKKWLADRNKSEAMDHGTHAGAMLMPGMLTREQMDALAKANGADFDRLFLTGMIQHHDGALVMVDELFSVPGASQDSFLYDLAADIESSQRAEIAIMCGQSLNAFLYAPVQCALMDTAPAGPEKPSDAKKAKVYSNPRSSPKDPRIGLKGGLYDAGTASFGLKHLATVAKPGGFAPRKVPKIKAKEDLRVPVIRPADENPADFRMHSASTNSDLAFSGKHLFVGNYSGINIYDIEDPRLLKLVTSMVCPGSQGDVSVYKNLMFMSAESMSGRLDCGVQGNPPPKGSRGTPPEAKYDEEDPPKSVTEAIRNKRRLEAMPPSTDRFRGVRIFDISDLSQPKQVAAVQSCRGSHTHTLVIDPKDKENVYVYVSGTALVRQGSEMPGCSGGDPSKDPNTALFRIDIIKVPLARPEEARVINSPRVFADAQGEKVDALWKGGTHGEGTQRTYMTQACHDITVYSELGLAAGACSGNGILLDIKDPSNPKRVDAAVDPNYAYWHSATFSNDGTKVLFTDEWGGGGQPRCRDKDPMHWGANAIFTLNKGKLSLASYYKMPAAQTKDENCVAHNGSLIPIPGRDIFVQSWYQGGISVMDFTDAAHPFEIAYFDRGPVGGGGGFWSSYWYNGYIYGAEMARGVDVFELTPNEHLSQNEIDAARQVSVDELNVQNQQRFTWPSNLIVARAYLDQLARSKAMSPDKVAVVSAAIEGANSDQLKALALTLEKDSVSAKEPVDKERMRKMAEIFKATPSAD